MFNRVIVWVSRFGAIGCILYSLYYLVNKFSKTKVIEATSKTVLPIPVLIFLSVFMLVILIALSTQMLILYIDKAKGNPFSFIIILPFGVVLFALTWFARLWVNKVSVLIEVNAERFMNDLSIYTHSLGVVMIWIGLGLGIGIAGMVYDFIDKKTR